MTNKVLLLAALTGLALASPAHAQAVGGADKARPVAGDPGMSTMAVVDTPDVRVLRDYAEPGATRRMHQHADTTFHVFTLVTGQLTLTVEGEMPQEVTQGQVLSIKGGAMPHLHQHRHSHGDHRRGVREGKEVASSMGGREVA